MFAALLSGGKGFFEGKNLGLQYRAQQEQIAEEFELRQQAAQRDQEKLDELLASSRQARMIANQQFEQDKETYDRLKAQADAETKLATAQATTALPGVAPAATLGQMQVSTAIEQQPQQAAIAGQELTIESLSNEQDLQLIQALGEQGMPELQAANMVLQVKATTQELTRTMEEQGILLSPQDQQTVVREVILGGKTHPELVELYGDEIAEAIVLQKELQRVSERGLDLPLTIPTGLGQQQIPSTGQVALEALQLRGGAQDIAASRASVAQGWSRVAAEQARVALAKAGFEFQKEQFRSEEDALRFKQGMEGLRALTAENLATSVDAYREVTSLLFDNGIIDLETWATLYKKTPEDGINDLKKYYEALGYTSNQMGAGPQAGGGDPLVNAPP